MTLYEINKAIEDAILNIYSQVDEETGEVSDDAMQALTDLRMARDEKLENIGCYIKNLEAEAKAIKEEEQALKKRREAKEHQAESLAKYVTQMLGGEKWESSRVAFTFRKSKAVVIDEAYIENIPREYLVEQEPKIDKKALKADIEAGKDLEGIAHIEERINISVK